MERLIAQQRRSRAHTGVEAWSADRPSERSERLERSVMRFPALCSKNLPGLFVATKR